MNLAIAVVYLVADEDERLFDLHLAQIEKTTSVPFRIYAAVNRLAPRFRERLARLPYVVICEIPDTDLRGHDEHPYYLEALVRAAIDDGATHVCTMHVDSFPVRRNWVQEISHRLAGSCVLAAIQRDPHTDQKPVTEFMMFTREFYLQYRPTFRVSDATGASEDYRQYSQDHPHTPDSGVGYGFAIWRASLAWFPLHRTDAGRNRYYSGGVYGELFFHLGGATVHRATDGGATPPQMFTAKLLGYARQVAVAILPPRIRRKTLGALGLTAWVEKRFTAPALESAKSALLADSEAYLRKLGVDYSASTSKAASSGTMSS